MGKPSEYDQARAVAILENIKQLGKLYTADRLVIPEVSCALYVPDFDLLWRRNLITEYKPGMFYIHSVRVFRGLQK